MNVSITLAPEVLDEIAAEVTRRVLEALGDPRRPSPYLSIPEAAEYRRCSRQRVDDLLSQRRFARIKEGRRTLISRAEIDAYLRATPC